MEPNQRKKIILLSILFHVLLLLLWEGAFILDWLQKDVEIPETPVVEPIVFDLQQPRPKQQRPREVIETPEDARQVKKQDKANYLSDKNALARNREADPNVKEGEAFSRGRLETHELPSPPGEQGSNKPQPKVPQRAEKEVSGEKETGTAKEKSALEFSDKMEKSAESIYRDHLLKRSQPVKPGGRRALPMVAHNNLKSRARDMGGLSFNTYNWNFAPYMLELKRRIQRNIFPPQAFTQFGLISGETLIRFRIYPDGRLVALKVLGYNGHKSLMQTSYDAVRISAPFPKLPIDFPEEYLEVTGKFMYITDRQGR